MVSNDWAPGGSRSLELLVSEPDDGEQGSPLETRARMPETATTEIELELVVGKSDLRFNPSLSTRPDVQAELRAGVSSHSFLPELCSDRVSNQSFLQELGNDRELRDRVSNHSFLRELCNYRVSNRSFLRELCTYRKLRERVSNQSFLQELCSYRQPLLCSGTALSQWTESQTFQNSRKAKSSRRRGAEGLTEELVEMIISRIPFPSLLKSRILSRKWYYKWPVTLVGPLQPFFQDQISSVSSRWTTYCPVYVSIDKSLLCFDQTSFEWEPEVPLWYLPHEAYKVDDNTCVDCQVTNAGPLICFFHYCYESVYAVYISNVITKSWRELPIIEKPNEGDPTHIRLLQVGSDTYKVLAVFLPLGETHVYNSRLRTRVVNKCDPSVGNLSSNSAYLDDKLYCLWINEEDGECVLTLSTYDVEHDVWLKWVPLCYISREIMDSAIFVCKDKLMVAIWFRDPYGPVGRPKASRLENKIGIFQLDLISWKLEEVCKGPPAYLIRQVLHANEEFPEEICLSQFYEMKFASYNDFICFYVVYHGKYNVTMTMAYNVQSHAWSVVPKPSSGSRWSTKWMGYAFQPGSNPFALV